MRLSRRLTNQAPGRPGDTQYHTPKTRLAEKAGFSQMWLSKGAATFRESIVEKAPPAPARSPWRFFFN